MRFGTVLDAGAGWADVDLDGVTLRVLVSAGASFPVGDVACLLQDGRRIVALGTIAAPEPPPRVEFRAYDVSNVSTLVARPECDPGDLVFVWWPFSNTSTSPVLEQSIWTYRETTGVSGANNFYWRLAVDGEPAFYQIRGRNGGQSVNLSHPVMVAVVRNPAANPFPAGIPSGQGVSTAGPVNASLTKAYSSVSLTAQMLLIDMSLSGMWKTGVITVPGAPYPYEPVVSTIDMGTPQDPGGWKTSTSRVGASTGYLRWYEGAQTSIAPNSTITRSWGEGTPDWGYFHRAIFTVAVQ